MPSSRCHMTTIGRCIYSVAHRAMFSSERKGCVYEAHSDRFEKCLDSNLWSGRKSVVATSRLFPINQLNSTEHKQNFVMCWLILLPE